MRGWVGGSAGADQPPPPPLSNGNVGVCAGVAGGHTADITHPRSVAKPVVPHNPQNIVPLALPPPPPTPRSRAAPRRWCVYVSVLWLYKGGGGSAGMHWKGGGVPPSPLQGVQPMPSHCPPDAKCQAQCRL